MPASGDLVKARLYCVSRCFPRVCAVAWKVFVQIGCPQGLVLDSKEFYSPVVTPHEVMLPCAMAESNRMCPVRNELPLRVCCAQAFVAFTGRDWDVRKYRLDFQDLLQPRGFLRSAPPPLAPVPPLKLSGAI